MAIVIRSILLFLLITCAVKAQNCGRSRRRPWRSLSCQEQRTFLQACQDLKASGRWDELVLNHERSGDWGHEVPAFLSWHRWLMWMGERELQRIIGTCLTIPYWDWERDGGIESALRPDGFGSNTGRGCVRDGIARDWNIVETGGCLTRDFDDRIPISRDVEVLSRITNFRNFAQFRVQLEGAPHTGTHEWVGGQMADRWAVDGKQKLFCQPLNFLMVCLTRLSHLFFTKQCRPYLLDSSVRYYFDDWQYYHLINHLLAFPVLLQR